MTMILYICLLLLYTCCCLLPCLPACLIPCLRARARTAARCHVYVYTHTVYHRAVALLLAHVLPHPAPLRCYVAATAHAPSRRCCHAHRAAAARTHARARLVAPRARARALPHVRTRTAHRACPLPARTLLRAPCPLLPVDLRSHFVGFGRLPRILPRLVGCWLPRGSGWLLLLVTLFFYVGCWLVVRWLAGQSTFVQAVQIYDDISHLDISFMVVFASYMLPGLSSTLYSSFLPCRCRRCRLFATLFCTPAAGDRRLKEDLVHGLLR